MQGIAYIKTTLYNIDFTLNFDQYIRVTSQDCFSAVFFKRFIFGGTLSTALDIR